ncbi:cbb3-type cytochrome c oxidase subunit 3 [Pseudomonas sp. RTC3]|uniref:cbb3-type cytochrome oxidase subunit 3 n=1 Tax=unclassified Pseudomonas TaxID=196821 RepID=UPI002AB39318|nr:MULTISPECIES: cbb3-type cytochrome c oxidase subunit 3 [unclassified Pseudomonas]MEB0061002.1 cbb3-type cytochrome c oxidase subunit 3 [Pseudomonas sp. RTC3]MDY7564082.1 cbb3-type cytochrome c oxidase subunit 3 [Pseudomonas sp. 5C2]MEB0007569.1 cbb3-type cytochrome c oxidase subunit 3 [Pseudomonas sp. RTB2]MEB0019541.1 cbb3-type cytochrome c oxidase subunit 3 [Pseudomonas sp. RTB3]MEB0025400.1 cbb3-type cytochrome c oxidase subunit 3 [Pseudomonas sp. MH9.2]
MDIGDLRGLGTLVVAIAFIGLAFWVFNSKRNPEFAEARMAPFADEPLPSHAEEQSVVEHPVERSTQP